MCYQPVHIKNPVLEFDMIKDKYMLDVPCGHCEECKKRKRTDWFVRTYYHFKYVHEQCAGFCLYVTLTYDNVHLPHITLSDGTIVPCFSSLDIQRFFKRLRINLSRHHNITDISYFLSSEYGGTTHRPHYHFLLFSRSDSRQSIAKSNHFFFHTLNHVFDGFKIFQNKCLAMTIDRQKKYTIFVIL